MRPVANPPNPFSRELLELEEPPPPARLEVFEEDCERALSENDSPDVPFRWAINPYRGCFHGCTYCYARPSHQWLGLGAGTDFDRKLVVKRNLPERLRATFDSRGWRGEPLHFSGITDCYQPLEAHYELTRRCLQLCVQYRNPAAFITKSLIIRRDAELLSELSRVAGCRVFLSIPFAKDELARQVEPHASSPTQRFETIRRLADAGVPVGVSVSPIIPGLNDEQIPEVLERAREAGASAAFMILLRLPREVLPVFRERLHALVPLRAGKVERAIREMRGGRMNDSGFGARMVGSGQRWEAIERVFELHRRRLGLESRSFGQLEAAGTFRRPGAQLSLFAGA